jgi:hypothetical protein
MVRRLSPTRCAISLLGTPLCSQGNDLVIAIQLLCSPTETLSLIAGIESWFPILDRNACCRKTEWWNYLSFFF